MTMMLSKGLFSLGRVVITSKASRVLSQDDVLESLQRHVNGDWGDVCEEDRQTNDDALAGRFRLHSAYSDRNGTRFWIITEWHRLATTILLPTDY